MFPERLQVAEIGAYTNSSTRGQWPKQRIHSAVAHRPSTSVTNHHQGWPHYCSCALCSHHSTTPNNKRARAGPRRAPPEAPIDSLALVSISLARTVGWWPLRRLVPVEGGGRGCGEGYGLHGFVEVEARVSRPNSEGWCQQSGGTSTWGYGIDEMRGGVDV